MGTLVTCAKDRNEELFKTTCGGMGLTGVILAARRADTLERFAGDLRIRYQIDVEVKEFDAADVLSHKRFFDSLNPMPAGVIVCFGYRGTIPDSSKGLPEILQTIEVNFTGCASILSMVAEASEIKGPGFIIGLSSVAGDRGRASNYIYGASKAAVTVLLSGLRNRLSARRVQVMTVKPGFVRTKMTKNLPLPALLTSRPEDLASHIFSSQQMGREVIYSSWMWRGIMVGIGSLVKIREHLQNGDQCVIVTASVAQVVKPFAREMGMKFLSTEMEVRNGLFTGRISGANCSGPEKARMIKEKFIYNFRQP